MEVYIMFHGGVSVDKPGMPYCDTQSDADIENTWYPISVRDSIVEATSFFWNTFV